MLTGDGKPVRFADINAIFFGDSFSEYDMCHPEKNFYKTRDNLPALNVSEVNITLQNSNFRDPSIKLNIKLIDQNLLNIQFTFDSDTKKPFKVPESVINVNRTCANESLQLSDYVVLNKTSDGKLIVKIKNGNSGGGDVFDINGFLLATWRDAFYYLDGTFHTSYGTCDHGVFGL